VPRLRWSATARRDLRAIRDYVAFDSPHAAKALTSLLTAPARRLRRFPDLGRVMPEFEDFGVRELIVDNYRIIYIRADGIVVVARVVHASRDVGRISIEGA
jgi:plasmid stabilization system protein ParE